MPVAFFDVGDTLASVSISVTGSINLFVLPGAREALQELKTDGIRTGIISDPGTLDTAPIETSLKQAGIYDFLDKDLIVFGPKNDPGIFRTAAARAKLSPEECVFTGESPRERAFALNAGFLRVSPHPKLTRAALRGEALVYAAITSRSDDELNTILASEAMRDVVPLRVSGAAQRTIYVICTPGSLDLLHAQRLQVRSLGKRDQPLRSDLYLVRDDRPKPEGFASREDHSLSFLRTQAQENLVIATAPDGVYLAIPWDRSIEEVHFPEPCHGHNDKLTPDPMLLSPFRAQHIQQFAAGRTLEIPTLNPPEIEALAHITPMLIKSLHERYTGAAPLDQVNIESRHILHSQNSIVTLALQEHLRTLGGPNIRVSLHRFRHEDLELFNVVGELLGETPSLVLVTAHFDTTGAFSDQPYNSAADPAPGADDDASGMAAVLATAFVAAQLERTRRPKRTIRFVLFNAEEHGLVGSKAYARTVAAEGAEIAAVFQMDMIGFRKPSNDPARRDPGQVEIHAGATGQPDIEQRSLVLAEILRRVQPLVAPNLGVPQVYPDPESGQPDPAAGRSDHSPFQERGFPACVVSEDFFVGPKKTSPEPAPNPDYHKPSDRNVDYEYTADLARLVAAATLASADYTVQS
jgi:hypothetical protein